MYPNNHLSTCVSIFGDLVNLIDQFFIDIWYGAGKKKLTVKRTQPLKENKENIILYIKIKDRGVLIKFG